MPIESFAHGAEEARHLARIFGVKFGRESGVEARPATDAAALLSQIEQLREAGVLPDGFGERGVALDEYGKQLQALLEAEAPDGNP